MMGRHATLRYEVKAFGSNLTEARSDLYKTAAQRAQKLADRTDSCFIVFDKHRGDSMVFVPGESWTAAVKHKTEAQVRFEEHKDDLYDVHDDQQRFTMRAPLTVIAKVFNLEEAAVYRVLFETIEKREPYTRLYHGEWSKSASARVAAGSKHHDVRIATGEIAR